MDVGTGTDEQQNDDQQTLETEYGRLQRERGEGEEGGRGGSNSHDFKKILAHHLCSLQCGLIC